MEEKFNFKDAQLDSMNVPEGQREKFDDAIKAAVEAAAKEQAPKDVEGLGISVPRPSVEGKKEEGKEE